MNKLFAIDDKTKEVIVSESRSGSTKINFIERISQKSNEELYDAVIKLTELARAADFDLNEFKATDKVCQGLYRAYKSMT